MDEYSSNKKTLSHDFKLDLSLRFGREIVAVTGPNGSGKTTLLRSIAGLEDPDDGRIVAMGDTFFDHKEKVSLAPEKRSVGYVFQEAALFPLAYRREKY